MLHDRGRPPDSPGNRHGSFDRRAGPSLLGPRFIVLLAAPYVVVAACSGQTSAANTTPSGGGGSGIIAVPVGDASSTHVTCDGGEADVPEEAMGSPSSDAATCRPENPSTSFSKDVAPILPSCFGELCHTWNYDLLTTTISTECCGSRRIVEPGDPSRSYLYQKVTGQELCGASMRMPLYGMLSDGQIQSIFDWICLGAEND